jgi:hypothetical protein
MPYNQGGRDVGSEPEGGDGAIILGVVGHGDDGSRFDLTAQDFDVHHIFQAIAVETLGSGGLFEFVDVLGITQVAIEMAHDERRSDIVFAINIELNVTQAGDQCVGDGLIGSHLRNHWIC